MAQFQLVPVEDQPPSRSGRTPQFQLVAAPTQLEDVLSVAPTLPAHALTSWLGGPSDIAQALGSAVQWAEKKLLGESDEQYAKRVSARRAASPLGGERDFLDKTGSESLLKALEDRVTGPMYKPQTMAGEFAVSGAKALPQAAAGVGGLGARMLQAELPAMTSELAGQIARKAAPEQEALVRVAGAVASPAAVLNTTRRAVTPVGRDPAREALLARLDEEGIGKHLTAGERTGSPALRTAEVVTESIPFAGGAVTQKAQDAGRALNRAVARRMGTDADLLDEGTMATTAARIGQQFDDLSARNTVRSDEQLVQDVLKTTQDFLKTIPNKDKRQRFAGFLNQLTEEGFQGTGTLPGQQYQILRSRFGDVAKASHNDEHFAKAMRELRNTLDRAMARSISPEDADLWKATNQQYATMKRAEEALKRSGAETAKGNISPQVLRNVVAANNPTGYVRGQDELGQLARAAAGVMVPVPNSGTAQRSHALSLLAGGGGIGGMSVGGLAGSLPGALGALAIPALASRGLLSRPVQAYLSNNALPPGLALPDTYGQALFRGLLAQ